jgi:hypothetical protein
VYVLIEPLRPQVDRLVLDFVRSHAFVPSDFTRGANGVCRLHSQLSRQMARLAVNDTVVQKVVKRLLEHYRS